MSTAQEYPRDGGRPSAGAKEQNSGETAGKQFTSKPPLRQPDWAALDWEALSEAYTFGAAAAIYAAAGIPVFPVNLAKEPLTAHGFLDASANRAQIAAWSRKFPDAGVGIPMGETSGVFAVDVDPRNGGDYDELAARFDIPDTLVSETGGGGQHLIFAHPGFPVRSGNDKLGDGFDVKGDGGYIVAPNSPHESGKRYQWLFLDAPAEAPGALLELLKPRERPRAANDMPNQAISTQDRQQAGLYWLNYYLPDAHEGNRNNSGFLLALQLRDEGLAIAEAEPFMLQYAASVPGKDYTERHALASLRSAYKRPAREGARSQQRTTPSRASQNGHSTPPRTSKKLDVSETTSSADGSGDQGQHQPPGDRFHLTEMGNAERLVAQYGPKIRYCYTLHKWLVWDGKRWADDTRGRTTRYAKAMVRSIYGEAEAEEDDKKRQEIVKHAVRSESDKAIRAALSLAQSEVPIQPDELDSDATDWLLNCQNGTLDLRTGEVLKHTPAHFITKIARAPYNPTAECPTWLKFVRDIMGGNQQLVTFLQRAVGYSLTGSIREQVLFLPFGNGQNGKSTMLDTLAWTFGDYATQAAPSTFMMKKSEAVPNDVARLKGARFVSAVETEDGQRMAESLVKQITGGDIVTARFMRAEFFEFKPSLKLWLATNHKPVIRGTDTAIWRRIRLIPFEVRITNPDKDLPEKLKAEAAGILAWAVQGCLDWQRDGLTCPLEVQAATDAYRNEMDVVSAFLDERCIFAPHAVQVASKVLYAAYEAWCNESGERAISKRKFNDRIREKDVDEFRGTGNQPFWLGVGLLDNQAE